MLGQIITLKDGSRWTVCKDWHGLGNAWLEVAQISFGVTYYRSVQAADIATA